MEQTNKPPSQYRRPLVIPEIKITDYDAEQEHINNGQFDHTIDSSRLSPRTPSNESEEEDREIIESLTKAHSNNSERHVDVDEAVELEEQPTEDKLSGLPSLPELKMAFLPLPEVHFHRVKAKSIPVMPPPGQLPDISDLNIPRYVHVGGEPAFLDCRQNQGGLGSSTSAMTERYVGVPPSGVGSRSNRNGSLPCKGPNQIQNRRRLYGQSDSGSQCSSSTSSVGVASASSDEQPPQYWKLYDSNSSDKSDRGNKDDMSEILQTFQMVNAIDENSSSASKQLTKSGSLPKQSRDEDKK